MADVCTDNRFELIEKYKQKLIDGTNIEHSLDEMSVIDNILFRFWQMGWLDKLEQPTQTNAHSTQTNALDCVSRQAAIDALDGFRCGTKAAWKVIEDLPSVQPKRYLIDSFTRKISVLPSTNNTGKWLGKYCPYTCDQCGKTSDSMTPFCRYCGADMRE